VALSGGEPTTHPDLGWILDAVAQRRMRCYFATNGLFDEDTAEAIAAGPTDEIHWHVQAAMHADDGAASILDRNLARMNQAGLRAVIRYNFIPGQDHQAVIDLARTHGIPCLNYGLPFPAHDRLNTHATVGQLEAAAPELLSFIDHGRRAGLVVRAAKPFPVCLLQGGDVARLLRDEAVMAVCTVHHDGLRYNAVVNPGLTAQPCIALPSLQQPADIAGPAAWSEDVLRLQSRPVLERCHTCPLHLERRCIGVCLGYRAPS